MEGPTPEPQAPSGRSEWRGGWLHAPQADGWAGGAGARSPAFCKH